MEMFLGYLFIFAARVCDVSMATIRTLMVVQGRKVQAALIGFFEVIIYVVALGKVVNGLSDPGNLIAYALGFACGNYVGIFLEEKMALGNLSAQVVTNHKEDEVVEKLRENGFGVTVVKGEGKEGERNILNVTFERKMLGKLNKILEEIDDNVFITVSSTKQIKGGYFSATKKK